MTRYIAYYRVSKLSASGKARKEVGESSLGIEAQKFIVRNYYSSDIVKEFEEVASAKDMNRPVLKQAIVECVATGATLVTAKLDRLSRRLEDALEIYGKLEHRLVSCDVPSLDKFTLSLFIAFSEREREIIRLRIKSALSVRIREKGHWYNREKMMKIKSHQEFVSGKVAAKGREAYSATSKKNPNNVRAMQMIESLKSKGMSDWQIVEHLNKFQFKTSTGKEFCQPVQISRILEKYNRISPSTQNNARI